MSPRRGPGRQIEVELLRGVGYADLPEHPQFRAVVGEKLIVEGTLDGQLQLIELTIRNRATGGALTSRSLREIELGRLVDAARTAVLRRAAFFAHGHADLVRLLTGREQTSMPDALVRRARTQIKNASRKTQASHRRGDAFYRRIALDLVELVESRAPTPDGVLEELARRESERLGFVVPVPTLRTWLKVARQKQFLAPAEQGRLSALPGPQLYIDSREADS